MHTVSSCVVPASDWPGDRNPEKVDMTRPSKHFIVIHRTYIQIATTHFLVFKPREIPVADSFTFPNPPHLRRRQPRNPNEQSPVK